MNENRAWKDKFYPSLVLATQHCLTLACDTGVAAPPSSHAKVPSLPQTKCCSQRQLCWNHSRWSLWLGSIPSELNLRGFWNLFCQKHTHVFLEFSSMPQLPPPLFLGFCSEILARMGRVPSLDKQGVHVSGQLLLLLCQGEPGVLFYSLFIFLVNQRRALSWGPGHCFPGDVASKCCQSHMPPTMLSGPAFPGWYQHRSLSYSHTGRQEVWAPDRRGRLRLCTAPCNPLGLTAHSLPADRAFVMHWQGDMHIMVNA